MKNNKLYALGIDTSNYTTSIAIVDQDYNIVADERTILEVPKGLRGLRQSDAVFKHIKNIPVLVEKVLSNIDNECIQCISVSSRPRPVDDSYMPSFLCGQAFAKTTASALSCSYIEFSHQEGHIRSGCLNSPINLGEEILVFHLSGGTTELLQVQANSNGYNIHKIGSTLDISFGQLIDRVGVQLGMPFPAGKYMDQMALNYNGNPTNLFKRIFIKDTIINLSGIETQCLRYIEKKEDQKALVNELFKKISDVLKTLILNASSKTGCKNMLLVGGVSASRFIRNCLKEEFVNHNLNIQFANSELSTDNAVGIAALGMDQLIN